MPAALWTLLWLNFRAFLRRIGLQARSPRGIIFFVIGLGMLAFWLGSSTLFNTKLARPDPSATLAAAPVMILILCLLNLFTSAGDRAVTFTPAEVDFLFPGPFSRRSLLVYKLIKTGMSGIISALIFGVVLGRYGGSFLCRALGIWLLFQFMQLLSMTVALVQTMVGEQLARTGRRIAIGLLIAGAVSAVTEIYRLHGQLNPMLMVELGQTSAGRVLVAPFGVFARAVLATDLFDGLGWAAAALGIDLAMAALVVGLDANFLEMSATASAKRYDRLARVRRSGLGGMARPTAGRWKIPMLPWAAGTGPIVWRQLTTALRTARSLLTILSIIAVVIGVAVSQRPGGKDSIGVFVGVTVWMNLFLSQLLKFDFRGDLDHLDVLRSLPLRPTAVAAAQLVAPTLVLSLVQFTLLATIAVVGQFPPEALAAAAVFVVPINLLTIGTDNLMFLLFPFRPTAAVAGDMGLVGRQTIVFACRFLLLLIVAGFAGGIGACVYFMTDQSWPAAAVAAWFPLVGAIALMIWLIAMAFERFDPSVNTPV